MLKMSKAFVMRMFLWSALVLYLICDFFFFNGPMKQELSSMFPSKEDEIAHAVSEGICAKVYNAPIYLSQVDRRVQERLWRTGRKPEAVHASEMQLLRLAAMDEIIDENLMRIKAKVNAKEVTVTDDEINAELSQFEKKFSSSEELDQALTAQGIESRDELRFRIAARIQQEKYIQTKIENSLTITDEEAQLWYEQHQTELKMPERRKVRHVFLATLDHPSDEAKATLTKHLATLKAGQIDFSSLAATISEDERSKNTGGDLGWMRSERLPGDFATHAFSLPASTPELVRTKLGWHIIEVTAIKPPELLPFETMKGEILAAIADSRRSDAVKQYRHQLRLLNRKHVEIFPQVISPQP
jgi:parvulin-like peptidyl-prolyl isomerase